MRATSRAKPASLAAAAGAAFVVFACVVGGVRAETSFDYAEVCEKGSFFDIAGLECLPCPENSVVTEDGRSCRCATGYYHQHSATAGSQEAYASDPIMTSTCVSCIALGKASSSDGTYCVTCDPTEDVVDQAWFAAQAVNGECKCVVNTTLSAISEFDGQGLPLVDEVTGEYIARCIQCPSGTRVVDNRCVGCPYPKILSGTECVCPTNPQAHCLDDDEATMTSFLSTELGLNIPVSSSSQVTFYDTTNAMPTRYDVDSFVFKSTLIPAAFHCLADGSRQHCNQLANLCVLSMYDDEHSACIIYKAIASQRSVNQYHDEDISPSVGWGVSLPWLFYEGESVKYTTVKDLDLKVGFADHGSAQANINFVASITHLDGTWLGVQNLTDQLILCGSRVDDAKEWERFGTHFASSCSLRVDDLVHKLEREGIYKTGVLFYDVYILDQRSEFYPVPVRLENMVQGGSLVNKQAASMEEATLVRRFALVDSATTVKSSTAEPTALRYARSVSFDIEVQMPNKNKLFPPVITVEMAHANMDGEGSAAVPARFDVRYLMDLDEFWNAFTILLIAALIIAFFWWAQSVVASLRKRQDLPADLVFCTSCLFNAAKIVSFFYFLVLFSVSVYWLLFYKLQSEVHAILPDDNKMRVFESTVVLTTILATLAIVDLLWNQTHYDMFFVDWEKPRRILSPGDEREQEAPVSAWRTLFVCNEWNELQTVRIANFDLTVVVTTLILVGFRLERLSQITPNEKDMDANVYNDYSMVLRFALASLCLIGVTVAQVAFKLLFYHRYVEHPLEQFVDLCFVAKISCIFLEGPYSGYYIHGRNQMAHADTNLSELNKQFQKEEDGSVSSRGFVSQSTRAEMNENQTFEMFIPKRLRNVYDSKMLHALQAALVEQRDLSGMGILGPVLQQRGLVHDKVIKAQKEVSGEFTKMISDVENNISKQVREPFSLQRLLGLAPDIAQVADEKAIFYHDFHNAFGNLTFYKHEVTLIVWNVLVFCSIDATLKNTATAAALSWGLYKVLEWYRLRKGGVNLSQKSLIDSRFLI